MNTLSINNNPLILYQDRKIGVSVSGGADSAILLYILMKHLTQHIDIFTMFAPERRPAMEHHVDMIVETCSRLTGNNNFSYHKDMVTIQRPQSLFDLFRTKLNSDQVDLIYVGLTKFPPYEVWKNFPDQQPDWHNKFRSDELEKPLYGIDIPIDENTDQRFLVVDPKIKAIEVSIDERAYVPFVNLNKKDIAKMYRLFGVEKELYVKTRSCENHLHLGKHCGKCWWCHERMWAFGYLE